MPAQSVPAPRFSVDRFDPAARGSDWFALDSLDLRGRLRLSFGVVFDYANDPLRLEPPGAGPHSLVLEDQAFVHLGGALVVNPYLRLSANLPLGIYQQGPELVLDGVEYTSQEQPSPGDLRLDAALLLAGEYGEPVQLGLAGRLFVPTGSSDAYTGDGDVRLGARLLIAGIADPFAYAAHAGVDYRGRDEEFAGIPQGSELSFGMALGARLLDGRLLVGPELVGSTQLADSELLAPETTPVELLFGGRYASSRRARVGLGAGWGLSSALGTPDFRLLASLAFSEAQPQPQPPPAPPPDRDRDGVPDPADRCPHWPGPAFGNPNPGCPERRRAPAAPQPLDRDRDGVADQDDACPDLPGISGELVVEPGCPVARLEPGRIALALPIRFADGDTTLLDPSVQALEAVAQLLKEQPHLRRIELQGHTTQPGDAERGALLGRRRAEAVMQWLVQHGVEPERLIATGSGEGEERIELLVVEREPEP